jgi:hypothetical protein
MKTDSELDSLPQFKKSGWKYVYVFIACIGVTALILTVLYRSKPKAGEILAREKSKHASKVSYAVVFSNTPADQVDTVINGIVADIGADSSITDLIIGSTVTDPWCATITEYKRELRKALTQSKNLNIGKQTLVLSMIAGLLRKNQHDATVYLIGTLNAAAFSEIKKRTIHTSTDVELRNAIHGPVKIVSYLRPNNAVHTAYTKEFGKRVPLTLR